MFATADDRGLLSRRILQNRYFHFRRQCSDHDETVLVDLAWNAIHLRARGSAARHRQPQFTGRQRTRAFDVGQELVLCVRRS